ncbi:DNA cytosine methyltransferase, partial [Pedobacter quisquiliarum]|uniref:DNA cytosine methyltransferase n=1 Tax=Pedobacter quisquiliarum TaxID=1834438 RepID=UPI00166BD4E1
MKLDLIQEYLPEMVFKEPCLPILREKKGTCLTIDPLNEKNYFITKELTEQVIESKIQALSFFSGAGGLDIGAQLAKAKVISSHDFDKDSIATLSNNNFFNHTKHNLGNITDTDALLFKETIKTNNPEKLIMIGGPPCQPFSKAGYWLTLKNRLSHEDPRNMIGHYLKLVSDIRPDGFILENVESLLHPHNKFAVDNLVEAIDKLGFKLKLIRANSADYGVPQKRKRVFF